MYIPHTFSLPPGHELPPVPFMSDTYNTLPLVLFICHDT